jgi:ATP-dependent RNA helicase RhlE
VDKPNKLPLLEQLLAGADMGRTLIFTRTKHGADKVARRLAHVGVAAEAIHSNKSQNARMRALANFKKGSTRVLVASDIASRGLDVDDISHVVNFDLPHEPETYVHRIGRTGRAGAAGQAISFCSDDERDDLKSIERLLGKRIPVLRHHMKPQSVAESSGQGGPSGYGHRGPGDTTAASHGKHGSLHTPPVGAAGPAAPPKHVTPHTMHTAHAPQTSGAAQPHRKSGSPEQQQTAFWKGKRKQHRHPSPGPQRHGRH